MELVFARRAVSTLEKTRAFSLRHASAGWHPASALGSMQSMGTAGQHFFHAQKSRLLALLIAFLICCIGFRTPLPGLPESMLRFGIYSILQNWIWPWAMIVALGEMLRLFLGRWFAPDLLADDHIDVFSRWIIVPTLFISATHAFALAGALDGQLRPNEPYGTIAKLTVAASLMSGSAITILLTRWLQSRGAAPGFWAAMALSFIISWSQDIARVPELLSTGQISGSFVLKNSIWLILWIAVIVGIVTIRECNGETDGEKLRWAWLLPLYAAGWIIAAIKYVAPADWALALERNSDVALNLSQIAIFLLFTWIYLRRDRSPRIKYATLIGFGLVLIIGSFMPTVDGLYLQPDGLLILMLAQSVLFLRAEFRESQNTALLATALRSASQRAAGKASFPPMRK
jgi:hypothetical protein